MKFSSTLEEVLLDGFDQVGRVGIALPYRVNEKLALWWRVRVVDENDNLLAVAPYSLTFASTCCGESIYYGYNGPMDDDIVCVGCEELQPWAPTAEPLSILGRRLPETLRDLAKACVNLFEIDALEAAIMANSVVADIVDVHEKWITPAWAADTRKQLLAVYPPVSNPEALGLHP